MKAIINLLLFLFSLMPNFMAIFFGRILGKVFYVIKFRYKVISENMAIVFRGVSENDELLRKIYSHFGLLLIEIARMPYAQRLKTLNRINKTGVLEKLEPLLSRGNGLCILTGHLGNWELAGLLMAQTEELSNNFTVVKEMRGKLGNHLLYRIRSGNNIKTINRRGAIKTVLKVLKSGGIVTFVLDQNMTSDEGIFVDFFGKKACTMASLATIVRKTNAPVITAGVFRNNDLASFSVDFGEEINWISDEDKEHELYLNTLKYNQELEKMILAHADQWIWMHKRWKTQP